MKDKRPVHVVYVTEYGDDWENFETHIVRTDEELQHYLSDEYHNEQLAVNGIESIHVEAEENVSSTRLREILTVEEFCEVYPEVAKLLDEYFQENNTKLEDK